MSSSGKSNRRYSATRDICIYAMLASILFVSKVIMEALPNIHLLGVLTAVYTVAMRGRALIPLYIYVLLNGVYGGFSAWWVPYLYIWTLLWGAVMLLPKRMPTWAACIAYPAVCCLHGLLFGVLYAPAQALLFGLDFEGTVAWIAAGASFDLIHGISNLFGGLLVLPLSELLKKLLK